MKILLTGATGLIGGAIAMQLVRDGHSIVSVSRNVESAKLAVPFPARHVSWKEIDAGILDPVDVVIHLAGESIFSGLWTPDRRKRILASRVESTRSLVKAFKKNNHWPKVWINGSAIGYYGDSGDSLLTEDSPLGTGFLAEVCHAWEGATAEIPASCRVVFLRTGLVLAAHGGALAKMLPAFRAGIAGRLGKGNQWMSWIHLEDLASIVPFIMKTEELRGPVNAVAPEPVINRLFTSELARKLKRPAILPVPSFVLKLAGELSTLFLSSQRVQPEKLVNHGFQFKFANLGKAFDDLLDLQNRDE